MGKLQKKIDGMSDNEFLRKYVFEKHDNIKVSEKRFMYKIEGETKPLYSIVFEYTLVKNPGFFNHDIEVASKQLDSYTYIDGEEEANMFLEYMENAPYILSNDMQSIQYEFRLKNFDGLTVRCIYWRKSHFNSLTLHDNKDSELVLTWTMKEILRVAKKEYPKNLQKILIKTVDMNDIVNITDTRVRQIKDSIDDTMDKRKDIVLSEIERTKNYLALLTKLI